jgi:hypothetical protein
MELRVVDAYTVIDARPGNTRRRANLMNGQAT